MPTFRELYCARDGCEPSQYVRKVFCSSFSRRAVLPGSLCLTLLQMRAFRPERELIAALGEATSVGQFKEELHYFTNRRSLGWMRRILGLKISTRRLRSLAIECFDAAAPSGNPKGARREREVPDGH